MNYCKVQIVLLLTYLLQALQFASLFSHFLNKDCRLQKVILLTMFLPGAMTPTIRSGILAYDMNKCA